MHSILQLPKSTNTPPDDEIHHYFCYCSSWINLCGSPDDGSPVDDNIEVNCVVCIDVVEEPCPRCGCRRNEECSKCARE